MHSGFVDEGFGNDCAGGQFAFADDEYGVGFAYVANRMLGHGDPRATNLITAVRDCLRRCSLGVHPPRGMSR
ncbi:MULTISPECIES: hypothetical protein [unclassified Kribbella]|uniref:hypothetical protein n=1 Tax=unclassified Kribbella TaxID=2644121 RepID=UPI00307733A2